MLKDQKDKENLSIHWTRLLLLLLVQQHYQNYQNIRILKNRILLEYQNCLNHGLWRTFSFIGRASSSSSSSSSTLSVNKCLPIAQKQSNKTIRKISKICFDRYRQLYSMIKSQIYAKYRYKKAEIYFTSVVSIFQIEQRNNQTKLPEKYQKYIAIFIGGTDS